MPRAGIEPGSPRSKSKHPTIGLTTLYTERSSFLYYKLFLSNIWPNTYTLYLYTELILRSFNSIKPLYRLNLWQKSFFEGSPLVITPLCIVKTSNHFLRFYYYGVKLILTHPKSTLRHSSKILKRSLLRRNQSEEGGGAWRTWRIARKFVKWIYPTLKYMSRLFMKEWKTMFVITVEDAFLIPHF